MSLSFYSQHWYRIGALKLRLRQHVKLHRHVYRGEVWYVLQDHSSGQVHRFDIHTYAVVALLDGERTLQDVWELACVQLGDDMPTQDEIISLISRLHRANAVQGELPPDIDELVSRGRDSRRRKILQQLKSPLGIRIPLLDPERFLAATQNIGGRLFTKTAAAIWLATVLSALVLTVMHWDQLTQNMTDQLLGLENLTALWLIYPIIKLLHELGHGYAVKRWGGEVHEMGIMLLIFMPIPYVDASACSVFEERYKRALVGAAGIMVEVFIASLALFFWLLAEPGAMRAMAFNTMLIGGVSTVLFNGNPLLRFDAYYVLCDLLESPNLGSRGNRYLAYLFKRIIFGINDASSPHVGRGEAKWLVSYAVLSYVYRLFIMTAIVILVAGRYFFVGVALAIWSAMSVFITPIFKVVRGAFRDPQIKRHSKRSSVMAALLLAGVGIMVGIVPFPLNTFAHGVVAVALDGQFVAPTSGFITEILVLPGSWVRKNQPLVRIRDPRLEADALVLDASVREAKARAAAAMDDRLRREVIEAEITYLKQQLATVDERLSQLLFRSPNNGQLVLPKSGDLPGSFVSRGQVIGYIITEDTLHVRVPLAQTDFDLVNRPESAPAVRFAADPSNEMSATVTQQVPAASRLLPSPILTTDGGGMIARDPSETNQVYAVENYFELQLDVPSATKLRLDERVYVLFRHPPEALVYRWYRATRRLFLKRFDL